MFTLMPQTRNSRLMLSLQPSSAHLLAQYLPQYTINDLLQFKEVGESRAHIWCADDACNRRNVHDTRAAVARRCLDEEGEKSLCQSVKVNQSALARLTFVTVTCPRKFTFIKSSDARDDIHSIGPAVPMPALFTRAYT